MEKKTIKQVITIKASPHEVYEILMDSKKHSVMTRSKAHISRKVGGKFSVFNGGLIGENIEIKPDKKIVQSWRSSEWRPKDHYSTVSFKLEPKKNNTKLTMIHKNVPGYDFMELKDGWKEYYWKPMKEMVSKT